VNKLLHADELHHVIDLLYCPQRRPSKPVQLTADATSELEKRLDRPSVPIVAKGEPGPPRIVEIQEKYSAIEGDGKLKRDEALNVSLEQTAVCYMFIEGNPAPTFAFSKGSIKITEGGRYKLITDGDNNNMISLAISKVKPTDEGEYRLFIENCHGTDEATFMLYVSGKNVTSCDQL